MSSKSIKYQIERMKRTISVPDFIEKYVDIPKFLGFCKECGNYNEVWSCPEYDFDPMDVWNEYSMLDLELMKFIFDRSTVTEIPDDEIVKITGRLLKVEKKMLMDEFLKREVEIPGAFSLSAGSCDLCRSEDGNHNCARTFGEPCRHPEKLRYSIESLGGDVVKSAKDLFDVELKWSKDSRLPEYYILMCGLLIK